MNVVEVAPRPVASVHDAGSGSVPAGRPVPLAMSYSIKYSGSAMPTAVVAALCVASPRRSTSTLEAVHRSRTGVMLGVLVREGVRVLLPVREGVCVMLGVWLAVRLDVLVALELAVFVLEAVIDADAVLLPLPLAVMELDAPPLTLAELLAVMEPVKLVEPVREELRLGLSVGVGEDVRLLVGVPDELDVVVALCVAVLEFDGVTGRKRALCGAMATPRN